MKAIFIIILTLITIEVAAQNHLIGITGGANWTKATFSNISFGQTEGRYGGYGGITYEYFLKKGFSIGADITYYQRGFTTDLEITTSEKGKLVFNYDYLSVPVKAGLTDFIAGNRILGFVKFGLIPSLLIEAKTTIPTFDTHNSFTGRETFNITNRVSTFDLAGLGEIGIGCKIVNRLWLTASFIYQHSLTSITNNEYFDEDIKIRHKGMTLNIGLKWAL